MKQLQSQRQEALLAPQCNDLLVRNLNIKMVSSRGVSTSITRENVKKERQKLQIKEKFEEISEDDLCNLVNEIQTNVKLNRLND